jgi:uncharacterized integral membrane protein
MKQSTRIVSWIVTAPIAFLVIWFSASNLDWVTLHLWPLPYDMPVRIWLLTLIDLFVGFLLGAIVTWIGDRARRRDARLLARKVTALEQSLAVARGQTAELERRLADSRTGLPMAGMT